MTMETSYTEGSGQSAPPVPLPMPAAGAEPPTEPAPLPVVPVAGGPDTLVPEPPRQRLPRLDFLLPDLEPGQAPDNQVPGMAAALENIIKNVPSTNPELRRMAVQDARREMNSRYQEAQRAHRLAKEAAVDLSDKTVKEYQGRMSKEMIPENQILTDQRLTPNGQWEVLTRQRALNKEIPDKKTDADNWAKVLDRVIAPYGTEGKITDRNEIIKFGTTVDPATGRKYLSPHMMEDVLKHFDDQKNIETNHVANETAKFWAAGKSYVEGPEILAPVDPERGIRYFSFRQALESLVNQYKQEKKNPMDIYVQADPSNPMSSPAAKLMQKFAAPFKPQQEAPAPKGPNGQPLPPTPPNMPPRDWKSPEEVQSEIGHTLNREQALDILEKQFGYKRETRAPMAR